MCIGDVYIGIENNKQFKIQNIKESFRCWDKPSVSILCEGKIFDYLIKSGGIIKKAPE